MIALYVLHTICAIDHTNKVIPQSWPSPLSRFLCEYSQLSPTNVPTPQSEAARFIVSMAARRSHLAYHLPQGSRHRFPISAYRPLPSRGHNSG